MTYPDKITSAVKRLNSILPLAKRQQSLDASLKNVHQKILHSYIERGRSLTKNEMAHWVDDIDASIKILQDNDLVVFDTSGEPRGAYPFTMEARDHIVTVNNHSVHCMCALDALAVSPMFNLSTVISSRCHVTQASIIIHQQGLAIQNSDELLDVCFGINWNAASDNSCCADSLCAEMVYLKGKTVELNWLSEAVDYRQTFRLNEAVEFSARFFVPLISE